MNHAGADNHRSRVVSWHLYMHMLVGAFALVLLGITAESMTAAEDRLRSSIDSGVGGTGLAAPQSSPAADENGTPADGKWTRLDPRCAVCAKANLRRPSAPFVIAPAFYVRQTSNPI
jgi:hypothetical protein